MPSAPNARTSHAWQGATAARIGHEIRHLSGLPIIVSCLGEPAPDMHQKALVVLGNLSSDAFDEESVATKRSRCSRPSSGARARGM